MSSSLSTMVERATPAHINARIQHGAELQVRKRRSRPEQINQRMAELEQEWDVERFITTEAPLMTTLGLVLGMTLDRKFLLLPLAVQAFVLIHSQTGWYPLLPILRRLGLRTQREIEAERNELLRTVQAEAPSQREHRL